jgi:hypothetical protein
MLKHLAHLLFLQRAVVGNFPRISGSYWSSTEYFRSDFVDSYQLAWYQNFITGAQAYLDKKVTWLFAPLELFNNLINSIDASAFYAWIK